MRTNNLLAIATLAVIALFTVCTSPAQKIVDIYQKAIEEMDRSSSELAPYIMEKAVDDADEIRRSDSYNPTDEERDAVAEAYEKFSNAYVRNLNKDFHKQMREKEQNTKRAEENTAANNYSCGDEVGINDPELYENYGDDLDEIYESGASVTETYCVLMASMTARFNGAKSREEAYDAYNELVALFDNSFSTEELSYILQDYDKEEMKNATKELFNAMKPLLIKYGDRTDTDIKKWLELWLDKIDKAETIEVLINN